MKKLIFILLLILVSSFTKETTSVTVTVYHPVAEQCNGEYWRTASYKKIDTLNPLKHRWLAVSRDLETKGFVFGKQVMITGIGDYSGVWTIEDRMNKRWTNRVDLLTGVSDKQGKWTNIEIKLVNDKKRSDTLSQEYTKQRGSLRVCEEMDGGT